MSSTGREVVRSDDLPMKTVSTDGRRSDGVGEIQRARILSTMAEVSAERGVSNVTVARVVSRSGVSRRTFYEMFEDREACFLAMLDESLTRAARYVLPAYEAPARWHERMRASLVALLSFLEDEPSMGKVLIVEALGAEAFVSGRRRQVLAEVVAAVDRGRAASKQASELPPLTADGLVGGALSVIHMRMLEGGAKSLLELTGPLMSMIVLPYLGSAAAKGELERLAPPSRDRRERPPSDPLREVEMRLTYRTVRVLAVVASRPGSSNREVGVAAGIQDQGQISKLLTRLSKLGLVKNAIAGGARGAPNAWTLTGKGAEIEQAIGKAPSADSTATDLRRAAI